MTPSRIALMAIFFVNGFQQANLISRVPRLMELFSMDNKTVGIALFGVALGAIIAMPVCGWLAAKFGQKFMSLISFVGYSALFPIVRQVPDARWVVVIFFLLGVSSGMVNVCINALAIGLERQFGKPIMASFHALFSVGMFAGAGAGSFFIKTDFTIFAHLLIVSGFSLVVSMQAHSRLAEPGLSGEGRPLLRLPNFSILTLGLIIFCGVIGESAMSEWSTNYMVNVAGASHALAPFGLSAFAFAMALGRIFGDRARMKLKDGTLMMICSALAFCGVAISVIFTDASMVMIGFFLVGIGVSIVLPLAYSLACTVSNTPPPVAIAMAATVGYSAFLFGPPLIGYLADWYSLRLSLAIVGLLFLAMGWLGSILGKKMMPDQIG